MITLLFVILAVALLVGAFGYNGGAYANQGMGLIGVLLVVILVLFLTGRL